MTGNQGASGTDSSQGIRNFLRWSLKTHIEVGCLPKLKLYTLILAVKRELLSHPWLCEMYCNLHEVFACQLTQKLLHTNFSYHREAALHREGDKKRERATRQSVYGICAVLLSKSVNWPRDHVQVRNTHTLKLKVLSRSIKQMSLTLTNEQILFCIIQNTAIN